jgi:deoxyribodipyrimidine photo-lyase
MRTLVWFRADLRTADNPALYDACRASTGGVVGVFVACPGQWRAHDWGAAKVDFVLRHVGVLAATLRGLNIPLHILTVDRFAGVPAALLELARAEQCDALAFNREYEVNELARDAAVTSTATAAGLDVRSWDDQTVLAPEHVRTGDGGFYTVFSPFRRRWIAVYRQGPVVPLPAPRRQAALRAGGPATLPELPDFPGTGHPDLWPAGETAAARRLDAFIRKRIAAYDRRRDFPADAATSELSPYLAAGVISARQCLAAALAANDERLDSGKAGVVAWISELIWREFYRHVLVGFPRVCRGRAFKTDTEALPWSADEEAFAAWQAGRTGVPLVDAGMRQLAATGWMHNRVRMVTAMYLSKDLFIDWRWGEAHFMRHLVDGDFASNNGGWQWSASTGTDAAPYFRIFNPVSQSRRFDREGDYIRRWVPELAGLDADRIHEPYARGADAGALDYPRPLVEHAVARQRVLAAFGALRR